MTNEDYSKGRIERARVIASEGGIEPAMASGALPQMIDTTVSEAIILGLLRQGVCIFLGVFGHGSTEIGEVLRVYQEAGLVKMHGVRNEVEASHAATALRWITGEKAAVITSIGPGALHALAASITPASDGIGVWYLFGDETTEDEGPNMQQIPKHEQGMFAQLCATMGRSYSLHTPLSLPTALRRGMITVDHPHRPGPFYLLLPMNTQPVRLNCFNLAELPAGKVPGYGAADGEYEYASELLWNASKVLVKLGGGSRGAGPEILEFIELVDAVVVTNPIISGVIPYQHPRNMTVGGSKGSISGNYAMENANLLVAVGTRSVCQSDCSRTGYLSVEHVINLNTDPEAATHYGKTVPLVGDAALTLRRLNAVLRERIAAKGSKIPSQPSPWLAQCQEQRQVWEAYKAERYASPCLFDTEWGDTILTQPGAIKIATDWARANEVITLFDAGDVQANGFQIVEDDCLGRTYTEAGASYMGFAVSALLATGISSKPFYGLAITGDGSFTMNPQILIDGVEHGARGCILLLDNRRMGAISGLQMAQYGVEFATSDRVCVDYVAWATAIQGVRALDGGRTPETLMAALNCAKAYPGLSLIHIPVYYGPNELGGLGAFGRWNVGSWYEDTQDLRHRIGL